MKALKFIEFLTRKFLYYCAIIVRFGLDRNDYYLIKASISNDMKRLPSEFACGFSRGVWLNSCYSAGKKLIFSTDAPEIKFVIVYKKRGCFSHMSSQATSGLDIYIKRGEQYIWCKCIAPENNVQMMVCDSVCLNQGMKEFVIFLPPFAQIDSLSLKIQPQYKMTENPCTCHSSVVVYGSSITQGCAASRPALSYVNVISRLLDKTVINFGFSESAKGEEEMIEFISKIDSDVLILEYDHNSTLKELRQNHRNVYEVARRYNQRCLIILLTRFSGGLSITPKEEWERIKVIEDTYLYALRNGDRKIELLKGNEVFRFRKDDYFVDDRHPNDAGMLIIAEAICNIIQKRGLGNERAYQTCIEKNNSFGDDFTNQIGN